MITNLTTILDRDYIIGHFIPSILFITFTIILLCLFFPQDVSHFASHLDENNNNTDSNVEYFDTGEMIGLLQRFWNLALVLFITIIFSILLAILNRYFIRLLEGYYLPKEEFLSNRIKNKYKENKDEIKKLESLESTSPGNKEYPKKILKKSLELLQYPDYEFILPTKFGNAIRAFEYYPLIMYNIDSIAVWPRIRYVLPKDQGAEVNSAKAQVDFAVNMIYMSIFLAMECIYLSIISASAAIIGIWKGFWTICILVFLAIITLLAYRMAISSAIQWGLHVKTIFDLYRHDLLRKMELEIPETWEAERKIWGNINTSFIYHIKFEDTTAKMAAKDNNKK